MDKEKIYGASRTKHASIWLDLKDNGINIISSWINKDRGNIDLDVLWFSCIKEVSECDKLILYVEPEDLPVKGALVEVGAALALDKTVCVVGQITDSWVNHPNVIQCKDMNQALSAVLNVFPNWNKVSEQNPIISKYPLFINQIHNNHRIVTDSTGYSPGYFKKIT